MHSSLGSRPTVHLGPASPVHNNTYLNNEDTCINKSCNKFLYNLGCTLPYR